MVLACRVGLRLQAALERIDLETYEAPEEGIPRFEDSQALDFHLLFVASRGCNFKLISLYVFVGNLMICIFLGRLVTFKHEAANRRLKEWSRSVDHCSSGYFESTAIALVCFL